MSTLFGTFCFVLALGTLPATWHYQRRYQLSPSALYAAATATVAALHLGLSFVLPISHRGHTALLISVVTHLAAAALLLYDAWAHPPRLARRRRIS